MCWRDFVALPRANERNVVKAALSLQVINVKRRSQETSLFSLFGNIVDDRIIFMLTAHRSQQICPEALCSICTCGLIDPVETLVSKARHVRRLSGLCFEPLAEEVLKILD